MNGAQSNDPNRPPPNLPAPSFRGEMGRRPEPLPARPAIVVPQAAAVPPGRRRPLHLAAWTDALLTVPWILWSYLSVIFVTGWFFDFTEGPAFWIILGLWFGSGVATLHPQTEALVARYVYRLRDLNKMEHDRIGQVWYDVCAAAGVNPSAFRVWIYDGEQITAPATAGHTIAVTTWSVYRLPPHMLRAVLAHELAHHLGTPPRWSALVAWYSIPARLAAQVIRRVTPALRRWPLVLGLLIAFWVLALSGLVLHGLVFGFALMDFVWFSPLAAPVVLGPIGKLAERYADRQAAEMGFGHELLHVFYGWQAQAAHDGAQFKRARYMSADPTIATRLKALEKHLGAGREPGQFGTVPGQF